MTKEIYIPNYNNKLVNDTFIHIAMAPTQPLTQLPIPVIILEQHSKTNILSAMEGKTTSTKQIAAEMIDLLRLKLFEISSVFTWVSHKMDRNSFIEHFMAQNPGANQLTNIAIYIYKKNNA